MTLKYSEPQMLSMLGALLLPGAKISTAVYCVYKQTGFFASNRNVIPGYIAICDNGQMIGFKMGILNTAAVSLDMEHITKIKIKKSFFGSKTVYIAFNDGIKHELKFQISPKVYGVNFPNQQTNAQIMLDILHNKQLMLD